MEKNFSDVERFVTAIVHIPKKGESASQRTFIQRGFDRRRSRTRRRPQPQFAVSGNENEKRRTWRRAARMRLDSII